MVVHQCQYVTTRESCTDYSFGDNYRTQNSPSEETLHIVMY